MKHIVLRQFPDSEMAAKWHSFLADAKFTTHYVTPNYFTDAYVEGDRFAVLAIDNDCEIQAVATGTSANATAISGMFSRPQMCFRRGAHMAREVDAISNGFVEVGGDHSLNELYSWEKVAEFTGHSMNEAASNESTSIVMVDLSVGADTIFAAFSQTRRNEIRKGIKQGIVEIKDLETDDELRELYEIQCNWKRRKGHQPDTLDRVRLAVSQRENRKVIIAKVDGKVVAGSFYRFCLGGVVEYAANFSLTEYQKLRPNDLIGWRAVRWACESGFTHFSMGGSHLFLRRFGGEIMTTYQYRRDTRKLSVETLRDGARDLGLRVYLSLPENLRAGVKRVVAR